MPPASPQFGRRFGRNRRDVSGIRVGGVGPVPSPVMLILERPGYEAAAANPPDPLASIPGSELTRYMDFGGLKLSNMFTTYLVKDYRLGEPPTEQEILRDQSELESEIVMCEPQVIGACGKFVVSWLLGEEVDLDIIHGVPQWYHHPDLGPIMVVPIQHPASAFYGADNQPTVMDDFNRLGRASRFELYPHSEPTWTAYREPGHINPFHLPESSAYTHKAALDTEGWLRNPWGMSTCIKPGVGIVSLKEDVSVGIIAHNIESACREDERFIVYLHNCLHDLPILDDLGVHIPEGRYRDTMVFAYLLQIEPQGLKPLAYRHLGMKMKSYMEVVAPYYQAVFEEWIQTAAELPDLRDWEEEYVIIDQGVPKIKKPWGIARHLRRILKDMDKSRVEGKEFDLPKRWNNIDDYKKVEVIRAIGDPPEESLEFVPEDEAIPYSGCDAVATYGVADKLEQLVDEHDLRQVCEIDHSVLPMIDRMQRIGMKADPEYFDRLAEECTEKCEEIRHAIHRLTGAMINPDSGDQVAELLFDQLHLDRDVDFKIATTEAGDRYSTNDKILEALRFTHDAVGLVCDYRETSKVRSSFCWPIARFARQSKDRRIHPNLRITRVVSGRLSCTKPNLLAIPVRSAIGLRVRGGFVADEGHVYGDWDLDQVEMREMAEQSGDKVLCDAINAGRDIHTNTASLVFGKPYEEIHGDKKLKKTMREPAKRIGFGVITGITEIGLAAQLRLFNATKNGLPMGEGGEPWTEADCKELINTYFSVHTGIRDYLEQCRAEARRFGFVRDRWGRIRYLPGVHSPIRHIREEALRQSHSHKISASAQGVMKQGMAAVWGCIKSWRSEGHWVEPLLQVHDEILIECDEDPEFQREVDFTVVNCLTQTTTLKRIPLGAKGGFGHNWGEMKD